MVKGLDHDFIPVNMSFCFWLESVEDIMQNVGVHGFDGCPKYFKISRYVIEEVERSCFTRTTWPCLMSVLIVPISEILKFGPSFKIFSG